MKVIHDLKELEKPLKNPVLTIGNFDGVHKGHLALFSKVRERAQAIEGQSVVMTFEPHPLKIMKPGNGPPLITPTRQKLKLISDAGIDVILCLPFSRQFAAVSAQDFVQDVLLQEIGIKEIVVGYDYTFGYKRHGDVSLLKAMGKELGFEVHVVEPVYFNDTLVSSTSVRNFILDGNLKEAKKLCKERSKGKNFWAAVLKDSKKLIGHVSFFPSGPEFLLTWEIGFIFNPAFQNRGYATEAILAVIKHAFNEMGAHRIVGHCSPENPPS